MNDKKRPTGANLGVYVALGAAIGAAIGFVADRDDFALWLAVGVAIAWPSAATARGAAADALTPWPVRSSSTMPTSMRAETDR